MKQRMDATVARSVLWQRKRRGTWVVAQTVSRMQGIIFFFSKNERGYACLDGDENTSH